MVRLPCFGPRVANPNLIRRRQNFDPYGSEGDPNELIPVSLLPTFEAWEDSMNSLLRLTTCEVGCP